MGIKKISKRLEIGVGSVYAALSAASIAVFDNSFTHLADGTDAANFCLDFDQGSFSHPGSSLTFILLNVRGVPNVASVGRSVYPDDGVDPSRHHDRVTCRIIQMLSSGE